MSLVLRDLDNRTKVAVKKYWKERSRVRSGKTMDGFQAAVQKIVVENGLPDAILKTKVQINSLPGFFRPTKKWDLVVVHAGILVAAIEFKSLGAKSAGKNLNNRCEEALGSANDFWIAYREGSLGEKTVEPFLGYIMLLEDAALTTRTARDERAAFPIRTEFSRTSYAKCYELLCEKMIREKLYTRAALLLTPKVGGKTRGMYSEPSNTCDFAGFAASLAAHVAQVATKK